MPDFVKLHPSEGTGDDHSADDDSADDKGKKSSDDAGEKKSRRERAQARDMKSLQETVSSLTGAVESLVDSQTESEERREKKTRRSKMKDDPENTAHELETENQKLKNSLAASQRRQEIQAAVLESDLELSANVILKLAPQFDAETNGKLKPADLIKKIAEWVDTNGLSTTKKASDDDDNKDADKEETDAWGASGGDKRGGGGPPQSQKIKRLVALGAKAQRTGHHNDQNAYLEYKRELTENKVPVPANLAALITESLDSIPAA